MKDTVEPRRLYLTAAAESAALVLLPELVCLGRRDAVVVASPGADLDEVRKAGFDTVGLRVHRKARPAADLVSLLRLTLLMCGRGPTLVHTYGPKAGLLGQLAARANGVPFRVHSCRGLLYEPTVAGWRRRIFRAVDRLTYALADRVLFVSQADLEEATSTGLCQYRKARYTGNGVDFSRFRRGQDYEPRRLVWRNRLGVNPDERLVLAVGRYVRAKGYEELAEAIGIVTRRRPNVRFVIVAPRFAGESRDLPDHLLDDLVAAGRVVCLERESDMVGLYCAADLLVHPSWREGVPRVVLEAVGMDVPAVVSDIPGNREVIASAALGYLFPSRDAAGMASAIIAACDDWEATLAKGRAAGATIRGRHSIEAVARRIELVYEEFAGTSETRP